MPGSSERDNSDSRLTAMAKEIQAASAGEAGDKIMDPATAYKRKIFYRRLKASLLGLTALALLLAGCLLGFVLPASLEVPGQERANSTNRNEGLVALGNDSFSNNNSIDATPLPEPNGQKTTLASADQSQAQVTKGRPTKFWALNWHDSIQKQTKQNMIMTSTTPTPPSTTNGYKWWLLHWKEHVENALQKTKQRNGTSEGSTSNAGKRPQQPVRTYTVPTTTTPPVTTSSTDELRAQLVANSTTGAPLNQTTRANVRRVTSYPKSNITTTPPSVITRHV